MDIDIYSRLLNEEYLANMNYISISMRNSSGLTQEQQLSLSGQYHKAYHRLTVAKDAIYKYLKED
jgi:hypothetical protein